MPQCCDVLASSDRSGLARSRRSKAADMTRCGNIRAAGDPPAVTSSVMASNYLDLGEPVLFAHFSLWETRDLVAYLACIRAESIKSSASSATRPAC